MGDRARLPLAPAYRWPGIQANASLTGGTGTGVVQTNLRDLAARVRHRRRHRTDGDDDGDRLRNRRLNRARMHNLLKDGWSFNQATNPVPAKSPAYNP